MRMPAFLPEESRICLERPWLVSNRGAYLQFSCEALQYNNTFLEVANLYFRIFHVDARTQMAVQPRPLISLAKHRLAGSAVTLVHGISVDR